MFKKSLIFLSFISFFLINPVFAQTPTPEETDNSTSTQETSDPWYKFITDWFSSDTSKGSQVKTGAAQNYAKEKPEGGQLLNVSENNNYNSQGFDNTTRALSDQSQKIARGQYLYYLLKNEDNYENLSYQSEGCNPISLTEMSAAYYQRNEKILYDENNQLIDWNQVDTSKLSLNSTYTDPTHNCYTTVYNQIPTAPQGKIKKNWLQKIFQNDENKVAAATSKQLNNTIKTVIPNSQQGDNVTGNIESSDQTIKVVENNHTQEGKLLLSMLPASAQYLTTDPTDTSNRDNLRVVYAKWLHPDNWDDDDLPERDENSAIDGTIISCDFPENTNETNTTSSVLATTCTIDTSGSSSSSDYCNGSKSHCRGMSQYGAYGMALSGKNYLDILKYYYGDITLRTINSSFIKVKNTDSSSGCSGNILSMELEDYLYGLSEMSDSWGIKGFEALKAQAVAARTYAYVRTKGLQESICNSSNCQVFKCSSIGKKPKFKNAVDSTAGQIIVDATNLTIFSTEYARSFCGPSKTVTYKTHTIPSVNGIRYEQKALLATGKSATTFCKSTTNISYASAESAN